MPLTMRLLCGCSVRLVKPQLVITQLFDTPLARWFYTELDILFQIKLVAALGLVDSTSNTKDN
jgi:hypothetical protein